MTTIEDRARKIVSDQLAVSEDKIVADSTFVDDLGADSLDMVELVLAFEEEFNVSIPDEKIEGLVTFDDAVRYLMTMGGE